MTSQEYLWQLRYAMTRVAATDTAYGAYEPHTSPLHNHCGVVAHVVQKRLGGVLLSGNIGGVRHIWNRLPDGKEVDLSSDQFGGDGMTPLTRGRTLKPRTTESARAALFLARVELDLKSNECKNMLMFGYEYVEDDLKKFQPNNIAYLFEPGYTIKSYFQVPEDIRDELHRAWSPSDGLLDKWWLCNAHVLIGTVRVAGLHTMLQCYMRQLVEARIAESAEVQEIEQSGLDDVHKAAEIVECLKKNAVTTGLLINPNVPILLQTVHADSQQLPPVTWHRFTYFLERGDEFVDAMTLLQELPKEPPRAAPFVDQYTAMFAATHQKPIMNITY